MIFNNFLLVIICRSLIGFTSCRQTERHVCLLCTWAVWRRTVHDTVGYLFFRCYFMGKRWLSITRRNFTDNLKKTHLVLFLCSRRWWCGSWLVATTSLSRSTNLSQKISKLSSKQPEKICGPPFRSIVRKWLEIWSNSAGRRTRTVDRIAKAFWTTCEWHR